MSARSLNRRQLLSGAGAMIVGFSLIDPRLASAQEPKLAKIPTNPAFDGPAQIELTPDLDSWIKIDADGAISFLTGRVEIGNGILTALQQIIADELSVSFETIDLISGDTDIVPNQGITSATTTIGVAANVIRVAAATARNALLDLAATELGADRAELEIAGGVVTVAGDSSRSVSYGDLVGGKLFDLKVDPDAELKPVEEFTIIGTSVPRTDIPRKLSAAKGDFVENSRVDGMKFARILRAPAFGAKLLKYDETVASQPGIVAVLPFKHPGDERLDRVERLETMPGDFIAVVADREDLAIAAVEQLRKSAEWDASETIPTTSDEVYDWLVANGTAIGLQEDHNAIQAEFDTALAAADQTIEATYSGPYLHYGPISSAWSLADVQGDHATVWTASQWPFGARWMVAQALGYEESEQVQVFGGSSSGLYGRRDDYDQEADVEAAILSQAVGAPVRLQWSRAEEFVWAQYRPPQVVRLQAGLDAGGSITGLSGNIWTAVRGVHPDPMIAGMALMDTPYTVGPLAVEGFDAGPVLRTGYMRNVYSGYNMFALESFMDEIAYSVKADPVEFRMSHLNDERAIDVIRAATEKAGWTAHTEPSGAGIGVSFVLYHKSEGPAATYLAYVAEVDVDEESGAVRVQKMTCALDCGLVVNPDGVKNQVEGGVIQATSWALKEQVTFDRSIVTSHDWATYPILTFPEVPEIDVVIVNRVDQPWKGIGEPVTVPVASAIANAIYDATGARVRHLPLNPDRVKAALDAR